MSPSLATLLKIVTLFPNSYFLYPSFSFLLRIHFYLFVLLVTYLSEIDGFQI